MLTTAFNARFGHDGPKNKFTTAPREPRDYDSWTYIGRFIWGFAMLEYQLNQLFESLVGGGFYSRPNNPVARAGLIAGLLLTYTLDLRKKIELIEVVLESRGIDESGTFKRIHALHDLRNVLAHWPFSEEGEGISCDFIDKKGETGFRMPGTRTRDNFISFTQLDSYDVEASELFEKIGKLLDSDLAAPITDITADLRNAIEEAVSSSENVVRFPSKFQNEESEQ
jgi:hypothetical protein